ncbi:MAG: hypothetical protein BGO13_06870 [Burkholderiales bacterium 66-5]|nr:MAG: hypothetical protein BGO13_06870 [Burkholderiales bacterium 66-5]
MKRGMAMGSRRRRWISTVLACAWLLHVLAIALAPLPVLAQTQLPPWATDICSQSHGGGESQPDKDSCAHALCCLLGCHGQQHTPAPPPAPATVALQASRTAHALPVEPARPPSARRALRPDPRAPPPTRA